MKTITFVRHGQSIANAGGITMEHDAIPLSPLGWIQAKELAALLPGKPAGVFVSAFMRAQQTAQPYCELISTQPQIMPLLNEFSMIDPSLLEGMIGAQRRPIADAFWQEADPDKRMGANAETFVEFTDRASAFDWDEIPDGSVLFGHGQWFALHVWRQLGFGTVDSLGMKNFRRFQLGFPMPNGAVYYFDEVAPGRWCARADEAVMRRLVSVRVDG